MKIYNVRIGLPMPNHTTVKSFTSKDEAVEFYNQYHPETPKELNQKDTLNPYYKQVILNVGV